MSDVILTFLYVRLFLVIALFAADTLLALTTFRRYRWLSVASLAFNCAFGLGIGLNYFAPSESAQLIIGLTLTPTMLFYFAAKIITVRQNGH